MLPFFRKIRWRLAADNQFFKYSRYAIGEIVLVVIGILIALYINNWNEKRKEREKFNQALVDVEKEMIDNISWIRGRVNELAVQDSVSLKFYIDSVRFEDYGLYNTIIDAWDKDDIRNESFKGLAQFNDLIEEQDSIMNKLIDLQRQYVRSSLPAYGENFIRIIDNRWESFKKYDWYHNWLIGTLHNDKRFLDFVMNDPDYSKMVSQMMSYNFAYRLTLAIYERRAVMVYNTIYNYLENIDMKHPDFAFRYDAGNYKHYIGRYESKWCSVENYVHDDSIVISLEKDKLIYTGYRSDGPDTRLEIIPMNKHRFRDDRMYGIYHLEFDHNGEVKGIRSSAGPGFVLDIKKIR